MQGAPEKKTGEDGLPIPPYRVYNIGGGTPENLLDYISTLQEELVRAGVLPVDYDFEEHRALVPMQPGDVPVTYAESLRHWNATSASDQRLTSGQGCGSLRNGIRAIT